MTLYFTSCLWRCIIASMFASPDFSIFVVQWMVLAVHNSVHWAYAMELSDQEVCKLTHFGQCPRWSNSWSACHSRTAPTLSRGNQRAISSCAGRQGTGRRSGRRWPRRSGRRGALATSSGTSLAATASTAGPPGKRHGDICIRMTGRLRIGRNGRSFLQ